MVFYHEMGPEFTNADASGGKTIRLARRQGDIFVLENESTIELTERLKSAGFDVVEVNGKMVKLGIPAGIDAHMHFRDPTGLLPIIGKTSSRLLTAAVAMPNTAGYRLEGANRSGAVTTTEIARRYEEDLHTHTVDGFNPMLTLTFGPDLTTHEIEVAKKFGIVGVKWYPAGGTTNADPKSTNIRLDPQDERFAVMEQNDVPLLIHAQRPLIRDLEGNVLEGGPASAEIDMLPDVERLAEARPNLRIVIEHVSTQEACELVKEYPNIHCTVTPQHLIYDDADIRTGHAGMNMPGVMRPEVNTSLHRQAIVDLVLNSSLEIQQKIMFGTDSAPHAIAQKFGRYRPDCCANGAYNLPVAFEMLLQFLEEHGKLELFPALAGRNAAHFYGYDDAWLQAHGRPITFVNEGFEIPRFMRGEEPIQGNPLAVFARDLGEAQIPYTAADFDAQASAVIARAESEIVAVLAGGERIRWRGYVRNQI